jgi:hypothetical protein
MTNLHKLVLLLPLGLLAGACGDDGGSATDGGGTPETCGFEDRYLPYQVGYGWTYRVTDLVGGDVFTKTQSLTTGAGDLIVQTTNKANGSTVSTLQVIQDATRDAVVRLEQEDRNGTGDPERTTTYDAGQTRLDEHPDKIVLDATWQETYTATVVEVTGVPPGTSTERTDTWTVLGVDVDCTSPFGDFKCLHVRRVRTVAGTQTSNKEFFFAKGIGKVKEANGSQLEELVSCQ